MSDDLGALDSMLNRVNVAMNDDAIPLAPVDKAEQPELSTEQWRFLWLHARFAVHKWQWYWGETVLRAFADNHSATISKSDVDDMVARGLIQRKWGSSYVLTAEGIRVAK